MQDAVNGGGACFSHAFAAGTTALEHFIIKRKLLGPSWLVLDVPKARPMPVPLCL